MGRVGSLLIAGTTSDAGKTTVVTGLCRWLARQGVRVAPYKAQNMSNNSMVCADGAEIGRAQWIQAVAAGAEPEAAMNPVLLKPGSDRRSHVVLMGEPWGELTARGFLTERAELAKAAFAAYDDLASRYDVVISEGAGSPTEINLRRSDYVNMGLAQHSQAPVVVVGDIDRGGVFASMFGTVALLDAADQGLISGFLVNKFRGDVSLLQPGIDMLTAVDRPADVRRAPVAARALAGLRGRARHPGTANARRPTCSRSPWSGSRGSATSPIWTRWRSSRPTACSSPRARPRSATRISSSCPARGRPCPIWSGCGRTVWPTPWRPGSRPDGRCSASVAATRLLGEAISDPHGVEGGGDHAGLGLLPVATTFRGGEDAGPAGAHGVRDPPRRGDGHRGRDGLPGWLPRPGNTWGTIWHGLLDDDATRHTFLTEVAELTGKPARRHVPALREARLDRLADTIEEHADGADAADRAVRRAAVAPETV